MCDFPGLTILYSTVILSQDYFASQSMNQTVRLVREKLNKVISLCGLLASFPCKKLATVLQNLFSYLFFSSFRLNLVLSIYKLDQHQRNQGLTIEEESNKFLGMERFGWMHKFGFLASPFVIIIMFFFFWSVVHHCTWHL